MCWSWEVSLTFALIQWICIAYLIYRNKLLDKWCAAMQSFIATQETLQFCLWAWGIDNTTSKYSCSTSNTVFSYLLMFVVMGITVFYPFVWMYKSFDYNKKTTRTKVATIFLIFSFIHYIVYISVTITHHANGDDIFCTYVSERGHQKWAFLSVDDRHKIFAYASTLLYIGLSIEGCLLFRPAFIFIPFSIYSFISAIIAIVTTLPLSGEWGSLWCWANSFNCVFYILNYPFINYMIKNNYLNKKNHSDVYKGIFFGTFDLLEKGKEKPITETEMTNEININKFQELKKTETEIKIDNEIDNEINNENLLNTKYKIDDNW
eukprot:424482_1